MRKYGSEIKSHLEDAAVNLQAAREALAQGQYDSAVLRAGESAFHTGSMLLLDEEIETSRHGDVITLIQEVFVQGRQLTKEQGGNLAWLFALRNAGQSGTAGLATSNEAHKAVDVSGTFFDAARVILEA